MRRREPDQRAVRGIQRSQITTLVQIAEGARVGEVLRDGPAAVLLGDNVIDPECGERERLREEAILAPRLRPVANFAAKRGGDVGLAHGAV